MGFFAALAILAGLYAGYSVMTDNTTEKTVSHVQDVDVQSPVVGAAPAVNTEGTQIIKPAVNTEGIQIIKPSVNTETIKNIDESEAVTQ